MDRDRMDTLVIGCSSPPDRGAGIGTYSKELAECFASRGYDILYVSPRPKDLTWLATHGFEHAETDPMGDQLQIARDVFDAITRVNPVGVINNDNSILQSLMPLLPCPGLAVGHLDATTIATMAVTNKEWCDYIVSISNDMKDNYVIKLGVSIARCPIVHNGLKVPDRVGEKEPEGRNLKMVCATEYSRRKGGDHVYELVRLLEKSGPEVDMEWYGYMPESMKRKLSGKRCVRIMGRVEREVLMEAMRKADVFIMASRMEGCPMSLLEAMSYGTVPVVSDGVGAMRWIVHSGVDGFVCSLGNWANQAHDCVVELACNRKRLVFMQEKTRKRFLDEFTIDRVVDDLLFLINNPTVDRAQPPRVVSIYDWHRKNKTLADRVNWRIGRLTKAGVLYDT